MTKRAASPAYRWLNVGAVLTGVVASLFGANLLQGQDNNTATALNSAPVVESSTVIHLPSSPVQQNGEEQPFVIELVPIPTVAAPASVPMPRPVARSRSSR